MISDNDFLLQFIQDEGLVNSEAVDQAVEQVLGRSEGTEDVKRDAVELLIHQNHFSREDVIELLSREFRMKSVNLSQVNISPMALNLVNEEIALKYRVFPVDLRDDKLHLAISDPFDIDKVDSIAHLLGKEVEPRLTTAESINEAIEKYYKNADMSSGASSMFKGEGEADEVGDIEIEGAAEATLEDERAPVVRYVYKIVSNAIERRASDIHLEPMETRFRVRYRVDGRLQEAENPPKRLQALIISRLKLLANVSLAERRVPQDGRIQMRTGKRNVDLRVSVLPTVYGESIVIRILDKESLNMDLSSLGFLNEDREKFEKVIGLPDGTFLVTGPTGSGKSTTLYTALSHINRPDYKIITAEDPVEYEISGVNQVQVAPKVGMTFSSALRAMLRQSPNVLLVGEIRDAETAEIAINAALTGHLVFSTLHTNNATSAITRLKDIGVKPFLISAALRGVLAQRLVRKLCVCAEPCELEGEEKKLIENFQGLASSDNKFKRPIGCTTCRGQGFRGRMGIFELLLLDESLQSMIYEKAELSQLNERARSQGMTTMREDGFRKCAVGLTTVSEVLRVTLGDEA